MGINTAVLSGEALRVEGSSSVSGTAIFSSPKSAPGPEILSHVHYGNNGDWYIRSAKPEGTVFMQDSGGTVAFGTATPSPGTLITALPLTPLGDALSFSLTGSRLSANQGRQH